MTQLLVRDLIPALLAALGDLPVVVLTGMRQTGKSTLLTSTKGLSGRRYATLDDFAQLEAARADPEGFLAGDEPLTIDEVQRAPELLVAVKRAVRSGPATRSIPALRVGQLVRAQRRER